MRGVNDYIKYCLMTASPQALGFGWKILPPTGFDGFKTIIKGCRQGPRYLYTISLSRKGVILKSFDFECSQPWAFIPGFPTIPTDDSVPDHYTFTLNISQFWIEFNDELGKGVAGFSEQFPNTRLAQTEVDIVKRFFASQAYRAYYRGEGHEELDGDWSRICMIFGYMTKNLISTLKPIKFHFKNQKKAEFVKRCIQEKFSLEAVELRLQGFEQIYDLIFEPIFNCLKLYIKTPGLPSDKVAEMTVFLDKQEKLCCLRKSMQTYTLESLVIRLLSLDLEKIPEEAFKTLGFLMQTMDVLSAEVERKNGNKIIEIYNQSLRDTAEFSGSKVASHPLFPHLIWRHNIAAISSIVQKLAEILSSQCNLQKSVAFGKGRLLRTSPGHVMQHRQFKITSVDDCEIVLAFKREAADGLNFNDRLQVMLSDDENSIDEDRPAFVRDPDMVYRRAESQGLLVFSSCVYFRSSLGYQVIRVPLDEKHRKQNTVDVLAYKYVSQMQFKETVYAVAERHAAQLKVKEDGSRAVHLSEYHSWTPDEVAKFKEIWYMDLEKMELLCREKSKDVEGLDGKTCKTLLSFADSSTCCITLLGETPLTVRQFIFVFSIEGAVLKNIGVFCLQLHRKYVTQVAVDNYAIVRSAKGSMLVLTPSTVLPLLHVAALDCKSQSVRYKGWFRIFDEGIVKIRCFHEGPQRGQILCIEDSDGNIATKSSLLNFMRVALGTLKY